MSTPVPILLSCVGLLLAGCAAVPAPHGAALAPLQTARAAPAEVAPPRRPKLIVMLVVDQFSSELYRRYRAGYTAGLRTLSDGVAYPVGYQSHAATETCPGHSTILTGRHPSATGIVANSWFDLKTGSNIYCVSVKGEADPNARGPGYLRVPTFGDWLKQAEPGARVITVSGKDRAAIMLGGHAADAVYWWADGEGFRSSSFAGPLGADVTAPAKAYDERLFAGWRQAPPALWPALPATCAPLAKPYVFGKATVSGAVPPEAAKRVEQGAEYLASAAFQDQLRGSPLIDHLTVDFASDLIDQRQLGRGPATDLLAVSLSATDYVGHRYGNGGAEMCTQMAALDAEIGRLLAKLTALDVPVMVALTADHGAIDAAERAKDGAHPEAQRIDGGAIVGALNTALRQQFALGYDPIDGGDPQQLFINVPGDDAAFRGRLQAATIAWLKAQPAVADVMTGAQIAAAAPPPGKPADQLTMRERFAESYDPERSGQIVVTYARAASQGIPRGPGDTVAGHGSPWDYDRQVPILFWWPGVTASDRAAPAETVDIAPTLSAIAGVTPPRMDGRCLDLATGTCGPR